MRRERINYFAVGVLVLVAGALLLVTLYRLTGQLRNTTDYHTYLDDVTGIGSATLVTYEGFRIGYVDSIKPEQAAGGTRYRVNLHLRDDWRIPADSILRARVEGFLSKLVLNIEEGAAPEHIAAGGEIQGALSADMMAVLGGFAEQMSAMMEQDVRPLLADLHTHVDRLGGELDQQLPVILQAAQSSMQRMDEITRRLDAALDANAQQQVQSTLRHMEEASRNIAAVSASLGDSQQRLDQVLDGAGEMLGDNREDVRESVTALRELLDNVMRSTDGILMDMQTTSRNMSEFSREVRQDPGMFLRGPRAGGREVWDE